MQAQARAKKVRRKEESFFLKNFEKRKRNFINFRKFQTKLKNTKKILYFSIAKNTKKILYFSIAKKKKKLYFSIPNILLQKYKEIYFFSIAKNTKKSLYFSSQKIQRKSFLFFDIEQLRSKITKHKENPLFFDRKKKRRKSFIFRSQKIQRKPFIFRLHRKASIAKNYKEN